jgi:hydroxymethylpyrimidine/phosphomethylpyrimidine kinase
MTAITAITVQNTVGVSMVHHTPPEVIVAQVRAVQDDIGVDAVKVGMLGNLAAIEAVATALEYLPDFVPVVLDPVMVAESGAELLEPSARRLMVELLVPRVTVVTPNLPEALALVAEAGGPSGNGQTPFRADEADVDPIKLARAVRALGPAVVVVTGGHRTEPIDVFFDGDRLEQLRGEHHPDGASHGSGCTHSSVLAARLAWGDDPLEAARFAKELASRAVRDGLAEIGSGAGPVDVLGLRGRVREGDRAG